jgi:hypothetical protein
MWHGMRDEIDRFRDVTHDILVMRITIWHILTFRNNGHSLFHLLDRTLRRKGIREWDTVSYRILSCKSQTRELFLWASRVSNDDGMTHTGNTSFQGKTDVVETMFRLKRSCIQLPISSSYRLHVHLWGQEWEHSVERYFYLYILGAKGVSLSERERKKRSEKAWSKTMIRCLVLFSLMLSRIS